VNKLIKLIRLMRNPSKLMRKIVNRLPNGIIRNIFLPFPNKYQIIEVIKKINEMESKGVFLFPLPSCPWGYMFQRPQQLARALAKKGYVVIYMVDSSFVDSPDWDVRGVVEIEKNIFLVNDNENGNLLSSHLYSDRYYVWQYWPHQTMFVEDLAKKFPVVKIYDCIDHLETFNTYPLLQNNFENSVKTADFVLATATNILDDIKKIRADCILMPNAVTLDDFNNYSSTKWSIIDEIRGKSDIIIGYYGAIAEWFDFDTIEYVAKKNRNWTFLFVGEVYSGVQDKVKELSKNKNVIFLKRISYSDIPFLLSNFDIAIIPFVLNDITLSTSPVKVFEYMAGGKITVSSNLPEIMHLEAVLVAQDKEEFHIKLHEALNLKNDLSITRKMSEIALNNTWDNRIEHLMSLIEKGRD
jgi:glycosyltransferase involved in cell wall biosynthesis